MTKQFNGKIAVDIRDSEPDWAPYLAPEAPEGAPNVLYLAWDDLGFATMDMYGGPVNCPNMRRIADSGVQVLELPHDSVVFADASIACSPAATPRRTGWRRSRSSRPGSPGSRLEFRSSAASSPRCCSNTATTRIASASGTSPRARNATRLRTRVVGRSVEGSSASTVGSAAKRIRTSRTSFTTTIRSSRPVGREDGYHLADDMADQAVKMIRDAKVVDPDKPFFMYLAPQAGHAPHLVPLEWADKYKGTFDEGYEAIREGILERQIALGLLPEHTVLSTINPHGGPERTSPDGKPWPLLDTVRPWDSLTDDERRMFVRMAEVFAGYIEYNDFQLGKVLDELERTGELDNTIIVVVSDNGASGEGGPNGSFNEWRFFNGVPDTVETTFPHLDELGTPASNNHYNTGWAWAFDTPFPYWKRWAGAEGGVADMCLIAWPAKIPASAEVRHQYIHAVDIVPTIYALLDIEPPAVLKGYTQAPIEGESFADALTDAGRAPGKSTQFYTMLGQRSIYHEGWLASTVHPPLSSWGNFMADEWELYHLTTDRSQSTNIADQYPDQLELLKGLWFYYAGRYNGLPLDDRNALEQVLAERPRAAKPRDRYVFYPGTSDVPESAGPQLPGRSYTINAGLKVDFGRRRRCHLGGGWCARRTQLVRQGPQASIHLQLGRDDVAGCHRRSRARRRIARVHCRVRRRGTEHEPHDVRNAGHLDALRRRSGSRIRADHHPARLLLPDR